MGETKGSSVKKWLGISAVVAIVTAIASKLRRSSRVSGEAPQADQG